jgi:hypothetical protein
MAPGKERDMRSRKLGAAVAVVGVAVAVILFVVLSGGDDDSDSAPSAGSETTSGAGGGSQQGGSQGEQAGGGSSGGGASSQVPTIVVKGAQPVGGVQDLTFSKGEDIRFTVKSDVADEVHLHGYDVMEDVPAGGSVEFDVPATIEGVFEVELEQRVVPLAEITVEP